MATNPLTLQLRYFQTLGEVAAENNETTIIPTTVQNAFSGLSLFGQLAEVGCGWVLTPCVLGRVCVCVFV